MQAEGDVIRFPERASISLDFSTFFAEEHRGLFKALYFVTGNRADAAELMQDAFLKLWERWDRVDRIDDPTAFQLPRGPGRTPAGWDLWSVPIDGGEPTLVQPDAMMGTYSVDGTLAFTSDPSPGDWSSDLLVVSKDPMTAGVAHGDEITFPRWSPDGTRIAYVDGGSVYVVDVTTKETSRVAEGGSGEWFDENTLITSPD